MLLQLGCVWALTGVRAGQQGTSEGWRRARGQQNGWGPTVTAHTWFFLPTTFSAPSLWAPRRKLIGLPEALVYTQTAAFSHYC